MCYDDFDNYAKCYLRAAGIYKKLKLQSYEFDCLLEAIKGAIILGNRALGDSILNICNGFNVFDKMQSHILTGYKLSYALEFGTKQEIKNFIDSKWDYTDFDINGLLNLASAYNEVHDYVKAKQLLSYISKYEYDTLKYQAISVSTLENLEEYKEALSIYKSFSHTLDSINAFKFDQKSKSVEEKHKLELKAHEADRQKSQIIWGCIGIVMLLSIVILAYSLYVKKMKIEHTNDLLKIQNLQNNLFEKDKQQEEMSDKIESLFGTRFKLLDGLASSYFECKETGQEQKRIYAEVKSSLSDFSSDSATQELTDVVNGYKNGLMEHFKSDYPKLSASQYRLALYLFCGFSLPSISIFIGTDIRNIYVYKSRLKSIISKSEIPRKEEYLKYFA